jgi:hypothetical protein
MNVPESNTEEMSKERRVSVRNDCRTVRMGDVQGKKGPRTNPADTVVLYQRLTVRSYASNPQHASLPHERATAGEGCYSKTRSIAISRCVTLFRPRAAPPSTAGERLVKEGDAANLVTIAERSGSQFRASTAYRRQALVRSELGYSKAGEMSRF